MCINTELIDNNITNFLFFALIKVETQISNIWLIFIVYKPK